MFMIGGNLGAPGMTADLEAIHDAGLSGILLFHADFGGGAWPGVDPQIECLSPKWEQMIRHIGDECQRLDLRFTMMDCPGWALAGGPWITPADAMRQLICSRTEVTGGNPVTIELPRPAPSDDPWRDYREIATVAFPTPLADGAAPGQPSRVTSNRPELPWADLFDPKAAPALQQKTPNLRIMPGEDAPWVEVDFAQPFTLRSLQLPPVKDLTNYFDPAASVRVEAKVSGQWQKIAERELPRSNWQEGADLIFALPESTSTAYRVTFLSKRPLGMLSHLAFWSQAHPDDWEGQAGFTLRSLSPDPAPQQNSAAFVPAKGIIDLSDKVTPDGKLTWNAPPGQWTVLRFGHVTTGARNAPAPPSGVGLECNKFSSAAADKQFNGYIGNLIRAGGPGAEGRIKAMEIDSWECGAQHWTAGMEDEFSRRRGYALRPWLPALAGYVVDDDETTGRFLRDWRATISDLIVENFYGRMAADAHAKGLQTEFEAGPGDVSTGDIMEYERCPDVPMCEFWQPDDPVGGGLESKPITPTVSAAHLYGKPRVAAESFTSVALNWNEHPGMLKHYADLRLADGLTHLVFHAYTHNPELHVVPGTSLGAAIGTPFLRGQTWWSTMPLFTDYIGRCQILLERGRPVTDVLWYLGDEVNHKPRQDAPFPSGYRYDYCNADVLLNRLTVNKGDLVTPEGLRYRVLWLPTTARLLPETAEKLLQFVQQGALLVGDRPNGDATLSGGVDGEKRYQAAIEALWGDRAEQVRQVGEGRVVAGTPLASALAQMQVAPDLIGQGVRWFHRQDDEADWWFVTANDLTPLRTMLDLRGSGTVELWDAVTGERHSVPAASSNSGRTSIPIDLPASGSIFVMIRKAASVPPAPPLPPTEAARTMALKGPWTLLFTPGWDTPDLVALPALAPWSTLPDPATRAFSGTATYATNFDFDGTLTPVILDLGQVDVIARVILNGKVLGTRWTPPFRFDLTPALLQGQNQLQVEVTNTWRNRLAYDAGLPEAKRKTWTIAGPPKDAVLERSGLTGPVTLDIGLNPDSPR